MPDEPDGAKLDGHHAMRLETGVALINALTGEHVHGKRKAPLAGHGSPARTGQGRRVPGPCAPLSSVTASRR